MSLCVSWITNCDYPLFRAWLQKYHSFFEEIIIYFDVQLGHPFYWSFVQQSLSSIPNIKFLDPVDYGFGIGDWRNAATNEMINNATGDWIVSIEQDWCAKDWDQLLDKMLYGMAKSDLFGWMNPTNNPYIHPAFFAIKRELLEKTNKDFAAHPEIDGSDHFASITYQVQNTNAKILSLQDLGYNCDFSPEADMFHLGGINQNYLNGLTPGFEFHRAEVFKTYNWASGALTNIPQDQRFLELIIAIGNKLKDVPDNPEWGKFFQI